MWLGSLVNKKEFMVQKVIKPGVVVKLKDGGWAKGIAFDVIRNDYYDAWGDDDDGNPYVEEIEVPDRWVCVMVGDDRLFSFDEEDLQVIDEDEYCVGCGQVGCGFH